MRLLLVKTVDKNPIFPVDQNALNTFPITWLLSILIIANNYHYLSLESSLILSETESKKSMKGWDGHFSKKKDNDKKGRTIYKGGIETLTQSCPICTCNFLTSQAIPFII